MKKAIIVLVIVGMFGFAVYDFSQKTKSESTPNTVEQTEGVENSNGGQNGASEDNLKVGLELGNLAPDFELETLDGKKMKLSDFRGKPVMINFWATWCPPCRAEMPDMQKLYENTDIEILAVNLTQTEKNVDQVENFVDDFGLTFPILLDEDIKVSSQYNIRPIPTSYMVDSKGIIRFEALGAMNYDIMKSEYDKLN